MKEKKSTFEKLPPINFLHLCPLSKKLSVVWLSVKSWSIKLFTTHQHWAANSRRELISLFWSREIRKYFVQKWKFSLKTCQIWKPCCLPQQLFSTTNRNILPISSPYFSGQPDNIRFMTLRLLAVSLSQTSPRTIYWLSLTNISQTSQGHYISVLQLFDPLLFYFPSALAAEVCVSRL